MTTCIHCGTEESEHYDGVECPSGYGAYASTTFMPAEPSWAPVETPAYESDWETAEVQGE